MIRSTQVLRGLDMSQAPTLLGYVEAVARPESQVVLTSKTGEPILALWRYGGGTDGGLHLRHSRRLGRAWLNWSGFGKFWVQLVRQTMRHDVPPTLRLAANAADGRLFFTLDAADRDGRFINGAEASVTSSPSLGRGRVRAKSSTGQALTQVAPGRYAGSQPAGQGIYWLEGRSIATDSCSRACGAARSCCTCPRSWPRWTARSSRPRSRFANEALVALAARRWAGGAGGRSGGEKDGKGGMTAGTTMTVISFHDGVSRMEVI